jgi:hypothetical protein
MTHASSKHICVDLFQNYRINPSHHFLFWLPIKKHLGSWHYWTCLGHTSFTAFQEYSLFDYWDARIQNRPGLKWSVGFNSFPRSNQESMKSGWCFGTMDFYDFPFSWECHPNWPSHIFQRGRLNQQPEMGTALDWCEGRQKLTQVRCFFVRYIALTIANREA